LTDLPLLIAESDDIKSLEKMVSQTRVIISTVGPFANYGTPLVDCCVKLGVDYTDITGEISWVKSIIDKHHQTAIEKQVIICPMCGFDSIPSDLGTFFVCDYMKTKFNASVRSVICLQNVSGNPSGGTLATVINEFEKGGSMKQKLAAMDAHFLNQTKPKKQSKEENDFFSVKYNKEEKVWLAPFPLAFGNTRVVRRTNNLLTEEHNEYGPEFTYNEFGSSKSIFFAVGSLLVYFLFFLFVAIPITRKIVKKLITQPGDGPNEKQREKSYFISTFVAKSAPIPSSSSSSSSSQSVKVVAVVSGGDPGYAETAKMVSEAGLTLALQRHSLPRRGGVLTPASAFGNVLVDNLKNAGIRFAIKQ